MKVLLQNKNDKINVVIIIVLAFYYYTITKEMHRFKI